MLVEYTDRLGGVVEMVLIYAWEEWQLENQRTRTFEEKLYQLIYSTDTQGQLVFLFGSSQFTSIYGACLCTNRETEPKLQFCFDSVSI